MKKIFKQNEGLTFHRNGIKCVVCGYTDQHLLLAAKTNNELFFDKIEKDYVISEPYKKGFKYMYLDENELI